MMPMYFHSLQFAFYDTILPYILLLMHFLYDFSLEVIPRKPFALPPQAHAASHCDKFIPAV